MNSNDYTKMDLEMNEYDAQLFGFNTDYFMTTIKILVKDEVTHLAESLTKSLLKKYSSDDPEIEEVKKATKSLIDLYMNAAIEPLKSLEGQLKELLHIPAHVLLPQDSVQRTQYSAKDEREVDDQIAELLLRLKRTKIFDVELCKELKVLRDTLPLLKHRVLEFQNYVSDYQQTENYLGSCTEEIVTDKFECLDINKNL